MTKCAGTRRSEVFKVGWNRAGGGWKPRLGGQNRLYKCDNLHGLSVVAGLAVGMRLEMETRPLAGSGCGLHRLGSLYVTCGGPVIG